MTNSPTKNSNLIYPIFAPAEGSKDQCDVCSGAQEEEKI